MENNTCSWVSAWKGTDYGAVPKPVEINPEYEGEVSLDQGYFKTWQEARDWMITRAKLNIASFENRIAHEVIRINRLQDFNGEEAHDEW